MTLSIFDLVYDYMDKFFPDEKLTKEQKVNIHREIKKVLRYRWCSEDILRRFRDIKRNRPDLKTLNVSKLFSGRKPPNKNLLDPEVFYYHNILRITCKPPRRQLDIDSGEIININEPYFLEMRASFSMDELIDYYCKQFRIQLPKQERARYAGAFKWLLKMIDIEIILFMIDVAANICLSEDKPAPSTPMEIRQYIREAMEVRDLKETEAVLSGGNKIVKRKRTRPS